MLPEKILLSHGSGGKATHRIIAQTLLKRFANPILDQLADSALLSYREKLGFTTDSFVVSPLRFPGGDIGKLSICGTVNDLVMIGAAPEYVSLALIIEEGLDYDLLEGIAESIAKTARQAGVWIVTGDLKVVEKGAADKVFITTSGVGRIVNNRPLSARNIEPGDKVILSGTIGEHGLAVLSKRQDLGLGFDIKSDCAPLNAMLIPILRTGAVKFMRDPTRGGLATTLNEITASRGCGIVIDETSVPVSPKVRAACELLGLDPLYLANEGKAVLVVAKKGAEQVLGFLKKHPLGRNARQIGTVVKDPSKQVVLNTVVGTSRIIDMLTGESLPRIC